MPYLASPEFTLNPLFVLVMILDVNFANAVNGKMARVVKIKYLRFIGEILNRIDVHLYLNIYAIDYFPFYHDCLKSLLFRF